MFTYPVQRQRFPDIASRISASLGFALAASSAVPVISMPGVQKPHWRPCSCMKPSWSALMPFASASPSTVPMSAPSAWTASTVHDLVGTPSTSTVHAPQCVVSQPMWVPVSASSSRIRWTRSSRESTSRECASPLTVTVTLCLAM